MLAVKEKLVAAKTDAAVYELGCNYAEGVPPHLGGGGVGVVAEASGAGMV
jgi:hypothetical protein